MTRDQALRIANTAVDRLYGRAAPGDVDFVGQTAKEAVAILEALGLLRFEGGHEGGHTLRADDGYGAGAARVAPPGNIDHIDHIRALPDLTAAEVLARTSVGLRQLPIGPGPYGADKIIDALTLAGFKIVKS